MRMYAFLFAGLAALPSFGAEFEAPKLPEVAGPQAVPAVPALPSSLVTNVPFAAAAGNSASLQAAVPAVEKAKPTAVGEARTAAAPKADQAKVFDGGKRLGAGDFVELAAYAVPMAAASAVVAANAHDSILLAPALAATWAVYAKAGAEHIAKARSTLVGGWQASHDQKMRHDYGTGQLIDIRGRKYGEDRFDKFWPGTVRPYERAALTAFAASAGAMALRLSGGSLRDFLLYGLTAAAIAGLSWAWRRAHPPEPAPQPREYDR